MKRHFRNLRTVFSIEGTEVDSGALWVLENEILVLVDDDEYVSATLNDVDFKEVFETF